MDVVALLSTEQIYAQNVKFCNNIGFFCDKCYSPKLQRKKNSHSDEYASLKQRGIIVFNDSGTAEAWPKGEGRLV